jgi:hypothetical protein
VNGVVEQVDNHLIGVRHKNRLSWCPSCLARPVMDAHKSDWRMEEE